MEKYIFNDNVKIIFKKDYSLLIENLNIKSKVKIDKDFYNSLYKTKKDKLVFSILDNPFTDEQLSFLIRNSIIRKLDSITEKYLNTRYEKFQIFLGNIIPNANKVDYIKNNSQKRILFIGAGGIFSSMIDYLISSGFTNIGIVDFDKVEITNFNRQYKYNKSDVGFYKIDRIKANLKKQYSELSISVFNKKISSEIDVLSLIDNYNPHFIVCAADTPAYLINKYISTACLKRGIPCIFGGVAQRSGSIGPLLDKKMSFKTYLKKMDFIIDNVDNVFPCKGSFGVTNSIVSNYMANDIIFYLMGIKKKVLCLNKELIIDFDTYEIKEMVRY